MELESRFNEGDNVVIIYESKLVRVSVKRIAYRYGSFYYTFLLGKALTMMDKDKEIEKKESECFKTIQQLADYYSVLI